MIAVIALLKAILTFEQVLARDPVSAPSRYAQRAAGVGVELVAVVAGLKALFAFLEITTDHPVTAARRRAVVAARVGVFDVAVIALFALVEAAVAAA